MKAILVVDDEYDIVSALELAFSLEGYEVRTAFNGREALAELASGFRPQLIITDLMMPEMDGYALVNAVRAQPAHQSINFMLMSAAPIHTDRLAPGTYSHFVRKPFNLDRLIAQVAATVAGSGHRGA